ncbi:TIGR03986 family CRISPR-associated RAMP protein [Clostridium aestuarii]|uniref:TIGR03986 family CRISPR-associated RAMP protein n=1 Tax=Clostridium aestuarii TaxID=338193 RepID=A0ABT4D2I5_9CLOT|nr:TIGR03986 family CRISPR-associated RAMP protein [Clostridium aestuarii]MCY6485462.1 TIGR03986 family CRISPR-associated RAMP protein [Clostridium aestuarii]
MKPVKIDTKTICGYSVSPYNFVTLPAFGVARYNSMDQMPKHNLYKDKNGKELLNGIIEYTLKAETPILISKGVDKDSKESYFFKNNKGNYTIPGSSIRGMVKTNSEILSFSSVVGNKDSKGYSDSEIQNMKFLYRGLADQSSLSKDYTNRLGIESKGGKNNKYSYVKNVKAGYIYKKGKESYSIIPAKKDMNNRCYNRIGEDVLRRVIDKDFEKDISFMYSKRILNMPKSLEEFEEKYPKKYKEMVTRCTRNGKLNEQKLKKQLKADFLKTILIKSGFKKYQEPMSFEIDNTKNKIVKLGKNEKYNNKGWMICSEYMHSKLAHFIINEMDTNVKEIDITVEDIRYYNNDLIRTEKMKKNGQMNENKEFYELPSEIGIKNAKPIFYIQEGKTIHFGFTPYLRVFYDHFVLEGIPDKYKDIKGISYSDAVFGFANKLIVDDEKSENMSYKTRVSFEDVIAEERACIDNDSSKTMLLAEPKSTCFNLYLKQNQFEDNKKLSNYNNEHFKIRGIKQYWLKDYITIEKVKEDSKMAFTIFPLKEGTEFKGKIYFNNLYEDELGLLLWSLKLNDGCYQNIGMGKSHGFGRIKVKDIDLSLENLKNKYDDFEFDYMDKNNNIDKYIKKYKEKFSKEHLTDGKKIDDMLPIKELMYIKSKVTSKEEGNNFRYMEFNTKEFAKRRTLPEILQFQDEKLLKDLDTKVKNNGQNRRKQYNNKTKVHNSVTNKNRYNSKNINNGLAEGLAKWKEQCQDK